MRSIILAWCLMGSTWAWSAPDELWIAAVSTDPAGQIAPALEPYAPEIQRIVPVKGLKLIDTEKEPLEPGKDSLATFKGGYTVAVQCIERQTDHYLVSLSFSDHEGLLVKAQARIARQSPILVTMPETGDIRLFVVVIR